jgi:molecular chaperone GrpE
MRDFLFDKFVDFLESEQNPPDYLGEAPITINPFDPYQMVAEWTALRHEIKQQGKILRSAQDALQVSINSASTEKEKYSKELEIQEKKYEKQQELLFKELLSVVDSLEHALFHWQEQILELSITKKPQGFWTKLKQSLTNSEEIQSDVNLKDIFASNQQGVEIIRRSLLDVLRQQGVIPIETLSKTFDPETMYAVGKQENIDLPENTVIQEIVRGYKWGDRILREAQVIVIRNSPH